jgi:hypothetical protein
MRNQSGQMDNLSDYKQLNYGPLVELSSHAMTKTRRTKLSLKRKSVRDLSQHELRGVAGGMAGTEYCPVELGSFENDAEPVEPEMDFSRCGTSIRRQTGG